jgi:two-component system nitrogen regulation sensor histidine kinase GlnL
MTLRRTRSVRRLPSRPALAPTHPWDDVFASFTDAIIVTDDALRVVLFNPAAEELLGIPQARVVGQACADVFAAAPFVGEMVHRVHETGQNEAQGEAQLQLRGRRIPVHIACLPVWDATDRIRGTAVVISDLSYRKQLEDTAHRNENLAQLGSLVAGLAHEIKNPLAGIKGAAQLLQRRLSERLDLHEFTGVISREADRLSALVEDLLTLGARPRPDLVSLNIHVVIQHVLSVVDGELTAAGIPLRCEFDPSLPDIRGDHAQLSQVFLNLIKNAVEATQARTSAPAPAPLIRVTTRMETDYHVLRDDRRSDKFLSVDIADYGVGIDAADSGRLFEPFFTTKARGTGLGLAISHRIIADHGGTIHATLNRPVGTIMTVTLPVSPEQQ